jgi:hypothetical protein
MSFRQFHLKTINLGRLGKITVAEAVVAGVMAALVALVWRYVT